MRTGGLRRIELLASLVVGQKQGQGLPASFMGPGLFLSHNSSHLGFFASAGICQCSDCKTVVRDSLYLTAGKEKGTVQDRPWDV